MPYTAVITPPFINAAWNTAQRAHRGNPTLAGPTLPATTWDPANTGANITLSNGNRTALKNGFTGWTTTVATVSKTTGKFYFEVKCEVTNDFHQIGAVGSGFDLTTHLQGQATAASVSIDDRGTFASLNGITNNDSKNVAYITGDIISFAIDLAGGKVYAAKNNDFTALSTSGTSNPATGTSPLFTYTGGTLTLFPAMSLWDNSGGGGGVQGTLSGNTGLFYTPPTGFTGWA